MTYRRLFDIYAEEARLAPPPHHPGAGAHPPAELLLDSSGHPGARFPGPAPGRGLANPVICQDNRIRAIIPQELLDCRRPSGWPCKESATAGGNLLEGRRRLRPPEWAACGDADYAGGTILSLGYRVRLRATPDEVWQPIARIGGARAGISPIASGPRGLLDRSWGRGSAAGPAPSRGTASRRRPGFLPGPGGGAPPAPAAPGGNEAARGGHPGIFPRASPEGGTELTQTARFLPRGLAGPGLLVCPGAVPPQIYSGMLRSIAAAAGKPITAGPERVGKNRFGGRDLGDGI